jgi:uncharacterized membrane protein YecN with MAPEG domain
MRLPQTTFYACALAVMFIALSIRTFRVRRRSRSPLGTGSDPILERAVRSHGNFPENVPFALVLLGLLELNYGAAGVVHAAGATLLTRRVSHAFGIARPDEDFRFRVGGTALTFTALGILVAGNLYLLLREGY